MTRCAKCDAELDGGRFCINCGHRVGDPVAPGERIVAPTRTTSATPSAGAKRPDWRPMVAGVASLVTLAVVLGSCMARDADTEADTASPVAASTDPETGTDEQTPAKPLKTKDIARHAEAFAPLSAPAAPDLNGDLVRFEARNMTDGVRETAWRMPGDGTDSEITFTFPGEVVLTKVGIVNGYAEDSDGANSYDANRRITSVEWSFDDGTVVPQDLRETRRVQKTKVGEARTRVLRMRITGVTEPAAAPLGRDYTAISDVRLVGSMD